jgi:hypothetical protein
MHSRRRFLQILAAAPFAPWEEISRELAKPIRTYSIPEAKREIQALELETFNKPIPNLMGITVAGGRNNFTIGDSITLYRGSGQSYGTFEISHVDEIARVIYFDSKLVENAALIQR